MCFGLGISHTGVFEMSTLLSRVGQRLLGNRAGGVHKNKGDRPALFARYAIARQTVFTSFPQSRTTLIRRD